MTNATNNPVVTLVKMDRFQTAFAENVKGSGSVTSGSVDHVGGFMKRLGCEGCQLTFNMEYATNFKRTFNAFVKRARRIAAVAGVTLSDPKEYYRSGYRQDDMWVMEVVA